MAMNTENLEKAKTVLDYWYSMEFLSQDKYDDRKETCIKMKKAQSDFSKGSLKGKTIWSYRELQKGCSIYDTVLAEAKSCGMSQWGNITVYIGKIKREACIECIAKFISKDEEEERPEKTYDQIAWASLQLASDGTYVDHSLSLSTVIWSMNQIKNDKGQLAESLNEKQYHKAVEEIEKKFFHNRQGNSNNAQNEKFLLEKPEGNAQYKDKIESEEETAQIPEFASDAVTEQDLKDLFRYIERFFVKENIDLTTEGLEYQEIYGLHFQLFKDMTARNSMEEDNYLGLSHDYFSEDIKYVLQKTGEHSLSSEGYMSDDLIRYITVLGEDCKNNPIDLIHPEDKKKFFQQISEILEVENAPLGKWPSRFMPAFMQQVAVNLCIRKGTSELYGVNGKIFSVNGPPGTGKTTLLREIVVNNIIERAILLSKYKDPDEAFEKHSFLYGNKEEKAYSSYIRGWYRLKDDRMNDYSTLITSCNNAAVENISKELPLCSGILKELNPTSEDTAEYADMLDEVSTLFQPEQSEIYETINKKSVRDIYFTEYAKALTGNDSVWGLVAAPLGKKSNISAFYKNVLYPLYWDFYPNRSFKDVRIKKYEHARTEFEKQLKVVRDLQIQLKEICVLVRKRSDLLMKYKDFQAKMSDMESDSEGLINEEMQHIAPLNENLIQRNNEVQTAERKKKEIEKSIYETEQGVNEQSGKQRDFLEKEAAARAAFHIFDRIFNQKKVKVNEKLANTYQGEAGKAEEEKERLCKVLSGLKESLQEAQRVFNYAVDLKKQTEEKIRTHQDKISEIKKELQEQRSSLEKIKAELDNTEIIYLKKIEVFTKGEALDRALLLDEAFVDCLLSQDIEKSACAQTGNPWITRRYDIEREKLFYYSMMVNKEFVLSSKCCRDNLKTLGQYWGMLQGDDKETVAFHQEDKKRFTGAVFQTLFLLVPVLSSTFASLGTFLWDAKQTGVIGTLIIDEAGQAQPQMAVGALYRSRKAMIVGDPKQVEPVVTDDLNLLKKAFDNEELIPYKAKAISVQSFADQLNYFGTWLDNGTDYPEWVGCPLVVHRRCISPMFDISNEISYNGNMKQQTKEPDMEVTKSFVYEKSQWINITGKEKGKKNHFVEEQARKVCEMLEIAFTKSDDPSIYIISPFVSVVNEMKTYIREYKRKTPNTNLGKCDFEWMRRNIGTVHTFQGKEANEVIFLLGCDKSREAAGAIQWVNTNIVNVAVTRAKFRLYIIGDEAAWQKSPCITQAKTVLDTFAIRKIKAILKGQLPKEEEDKALALASVSLPSITSFQQDVMEDENGSIDVSVNTDGLLQGLSPDFKDIVLSEKMLNTFGLESMAELSQFPQEIQDNLQMGIKLFYLLQPVYKVNDKLDASCCAILFCKAMELQMKDCFEASLKGLFPHEKIKGQGRGQIELKDARTKEFTLGTFRVLLELKKSELAGRMEQKGEKKYNEEWWDVFKKRLLNFTNRRNHCCHSGLFSWKEQESLLENMFLKDHENPTVSMDGILFESRIGKKIL